MSNTNMVLGSWRLGEWPEYVTVSHEGMREVGRRYVPERTCYDVAESPQSFMCGECGWFWNDKEDELGFSYCPHCGAKVVE